MALVLPRREQKLTKADLLLPQGLRTKFTTLLGSGALGAARGLEVWGFELGMELGVWGF